MRTREYKQLLKPYECFKLVTNRFEWGAVCDAITAKQIYCVPEMERAIATAGHLFGPTHPLHPGYVFGAPNYFFHPTPGTCSMQRDISGYYFPEGKMWAFPRPENVVVVSISNAEPAGIYSTYLPDYQRRNVPSTPMGRPVDVYEAHRPVAPPRDDEGEGLFGDDDDGGGDDDDGEVEGVVLMDQQTENARAAALDMFGEDMMMGGINITTAPPMTLDSLSKVATPSGIQTRAFSTQFSSEFHQVRMAVDAYGKRMGAGKRREQQEYGLKLFTNRCWNVERPISEVGRAMVKWWENEEIGNVTVTHPILDKDLTIFGNMCLRQVTVYEHLLFLSTTHMEMFRMMYGRLDAYRHSYGLHWNGFGTGKGATSKSFLFDVMEDLSVDKSVQVLTYQTLRADAIDEDQNDLIIVMNEAPLNMFSVQTHTFNPSEAAMKEKLTSMRVRVKVFVQDDSGGRSNRTTCSECIGCWFGATNEDPTTLGEAMASRFNWSSFPETSRTVWMGPSFSIPLSHGGGRVEPLLTWQMRRVVYRKRTRLDFASSSWNAGVSRSCIS